MVPNSLSTRPFIVIYIAWHPAFTAGEELANVLYNHYRRDLFENVAGGTGLSVVFRTIPAPGQLVPIAIDFEDAETTAVIVFLDDHLIGDTAWNRYIDKIIGQADSAGLRARIFPVAISASVTKVRGEISQINYIRWDQWSRDSMKDRWQKLIAKLSYEFCRMLRHYLEHLKRPAESTEMLARYLEKVRVFLSHSKHDEHGECIARAIRDNIHQRTGLASFDVLDIPAGLRFADVLIHYVRVSAVVALHTDSYSSREWCRREIIEAKRANVPLVIANCITDFEERGFPYMGNVPVVRMEPDAVHRIGYLIARLLDEVFKDFLWRCRVELAHAHGGAGVVFLPRPPELISLVDLTPPGAVKLEEQVIVYPDPPLGIEEAELFYAVAPGISLRSYTEWLAEQTA